MNTQQANQKVFNVALRHIRKQRERSITFDDNMARCVYRHKNGNMCAFGPLIKNYNSELECNLASEIVKLYPECVRDFVKLADRDLLDEIQKAHDFASRNFMDSFETDMKDVAKSFNLEYRPENKLLKKYRNFRHRIRDFFRKTA